MICCRKVFQEAEVFWVQATTGETWHWRQNTLNYSWFLGVVNRQALVWKFSCTICKLSFIQSFLCEEQRLGIYRSWMFWTRNVSTCSDTLCVQTRSRAQLRVNYPPLSLGHHATHLAKHLLSACAQNITYHPVSPNSHALIFFSAAENSSKWSFFSQHTSLWGNL